MAANSTRVAPLGASPAGAVVQNFVVALGDRVLVCGTSWVSGVPELRIRVDGGPSKFVALAGLELRYSASTKATKRCIGHKPFRDTNTAWVDCERSPLHDGVKCDRCAANDATFASQLHHAHMRGAGELDASVQRHLNQQNNLYLAAFRDGSIKVGTSTTSRLQTRLAEQGAWRAQIVATADDGISVRELEAQVTDELGIVQSVSARRKRDGLVTPLANDRLETELSRWAKAVHDLITRLGSGPITATSSTWASPIAEDPLWSHVLAYPLKLNAGNHAVAFLGASGRIAAFQRPGVDDVFVSDLRPLYGLELEQAAVEPDELNVQDSLF